MQPAWASRSVSCVWIFRWFSFRSRLYAFATQVILSRLPLSCLFRSKTIIHMVFHISVTQTLSTSQFTMCPGQYIHERECVFVCVCFSTYPNLHCIFVYHLTKSKTASATTRAPCIAQEKTHRFTSYREKERASTPEMDESCSDSVSDHSGTAIRITLTHIRSSRHRFANIIPTIEFTYNMLCYTFDAYKILEWFLLCWNFIWISRKSRHHLRCNVMLVIVFDTRFKNRISIRSVFHRF